MGWWGLHHMGLNPADPIRLMRHAACGMWHADSGGLQLVRYAPRGFKAEYATLFDGKDEFCRKLIE